MGDHVIHVQEVKVRRTSGSTEKAIQLWLRDVVLVLITLEDSVSVSWNIHLSMHRYLTIQYLRGSM